MTRTELLQDTYDKVWAIATDFSETPFSTVDGKVLSHGLDYKLNMGRITTALANLRLLMESPVKKKRTRVKKVS